MNRSACATAILLLLIGTASGEDASLKMRFVYEQVSSNLQIENALPSETGNETVLNERLVADEVVSAIRDVVVYVYTGRGGVKLKVAPNKPEQHLLTIAEDQFQPRILVARSGDTVKIVNRDQKPHQPHITFFNAPAVTVDLFPGCEHVLALPAIAAAVAPVECNMTPGMQAMLLILDHPYSAISDENGTILIEGLPAEAHLSFRVFHACGRFDRVKIAGRPVEWKRSRFETTLTKGLNDLGEIFVPASAFKD